MDAHREEYHHIRDEYILWLEAMNDRLARVDPDYFDTPGRKAINRINNNLMYHPQKPIYKDHIGAGLDQKSKKGDFYIHHGVSESFIYSGYYKPDSKLLNSIREAIDYNGDELLKIMATESFKEHFGAMVPDPDKLSSSPKGYTNDHPYIELLKQKNYGIQYHFSREEVFSDDFEEKVIDIYKAMLPFRRYFDEAVTV